MHFFFCCINSIFRLKEKNEKPCFMTKQSTKLLVNYFLIKKHLSLSAPKLEVQIFSLKKQNKNLSY